MEGRIVVDGVLASCYASTYHDLAYISMIPLQSFPKVMEWIFGNENEDLVYAKLVENFGTMVAPFGVTYGLN